MALQSQALVELVCSSEMTIVLCWLVYGMSALAAPEVQVDQDWHTDVEPGQKEDEQLTGLAIMMHRYW